MAFPGKFQFLVGHQELEFLGKSLLVHITAGGLASGIDIQGGPN